MRTVSHLVVAGNNPNVAAFLRVIRAGETGQDDVAYRTLFGGGTFDSFADHPRQTVRAAGLVSTAAGAYQFLARTWDALVKRYGFADFSPANQDLAALALIDGRRALHDVLAGDLPAAIRKCNREWASLPGSPYGQPTRTYAQALAVFEQYGGTLIGRAHGLAGTPAVDVSPVKESPMPIAAIISTFGPMLASLIPQVAKLFGSGSEVSERNTQAAGLVLDTVVKAANAVNVQDAIEKMQADAQLAAQVREAVVTDPTIMALLEVGGGIALARQMAADANQVPFWRNPAFIVTALLLPLVYLVVVAVVFNVGGVQWSDEMRSVVVTAIVTGLLGAITGFFLGSSYMSARKTEIAAGQPAK